MIFLGLGSNLDKPFLQIRSSVAELSSQPHVSVTKVSSFYLSKPVDGTEQNDFVNAVVKIDTTMSPNELQTVCQKIELSHHRTKLYKWGPRTLDIDILAYENLVVASNELTIPHSQIRFRDFVIEPLLEIQPDLNLPTLGPIKLLSKPQTNIYRKIEFNFEHSTSLDSQS